MPNQEKIKDLVLNAIKLTPFLTEEIAIENAGGNYWCSIRTKEPHFFIGRNGETLSAWNHLIRRMVEKSLPPEIKVMVDVNNYQKNKIENLQGIAHMLSEQARYFKSSRETEALSAFERRTVHEFLADRPDVKTESVGLEPNRRVIIKYQGEI